MSKEQLIDYQVFYEKIRFDLTLKLNFFIVIMLCFLSATFYFLDAITFYSTFIGLFLCTGLLVLMKTTKKYRIPAKIFTIGGTILSISTLLLIKDVHHFVDPLWMLILSLFTYFTLGKIWGNATVIVQFLAVLYYLLFMLNENLAAVNGLIEVKIYALTINAAFCSFIIAYLINQFIKRNSLVYDEYENLMVELQQKNILVHQQNEEKTAMLKEIHHRVKNNLQVVTSLLRLQSNDIDNEVAKEYFKEATDRVSAMALIHNKMYQSENLNQINLQAYLENLAGNIIASYSSGKKINTLFNISIDHLPSNTIVPIALIFNELLSNSIKHGFSEVNRGEILITISEKENNQFHFDYKDNGTWKAPIRKDSFGLELIETLIEQLNGKIKRTIADGTCYEMQISVRN